MRKHCGLSMLSSEVVSQVATFVQQWSMDTLLDQDGSIMREHIFTERRCPLDTVCAAVALANESAALIKKMGALWSVIRVHCGL